MNRDIEAAKELINNCIRDEFERIWKNITSEEIEEYEILVWGSTVDDNKCATDLDVIFGYKNTNIDDSMEDSIEGWIQDSIDTSRFTSLDPLVTRHEEIPDIVSRSRTSELYRISDGSWIDP